MKPLMLCIIVFTFNSSGAYAQDFFRINDSDGYVNLRLKPNADSKVNRKVVDKECVIGLYKEGNWVKSIIFELEYRVLTTGFIHSSRLVKDNSCSDAPNIKAVPKGEIVFRNLDREKSFSHASKWFSVNRGKIPDDGYFAEAFSDYVKKNLANQFSKNITVLNSLRDKDPDFIQFVIKHIDETGSPTNLEKIVNSKNKCVLMKPSDICNQVIVKAESALLNL